MNRGLWLALALCAIGGIAVGFGLGSRPINGTLIGVGVFLFLISIMIVASQRDKNDSED